MTTGDEFSYGSLEELGHLEVVRETWVGVVPNCSMGLFWDFSPFLQAFTRLCGKTGSKFLSQNSPIVLFRLSLMQLLFQGFKKCIPEYSQHGGHVHRAMATAFSFPGLQSFWVFWFARRIERMWQRAQAKKVLLAHPQH